VAKAIGGECLARRTGASSNPSTSRHRADTSALGCPPVEHRRRSPVRCALALLVWSCAGCAASRLPTLPSPDAAAEFYSPPRIEDYRIGVGDRLEILSYFDALVTQDAIVRPDGRISAVILDDLHAAGLTTVQLARAITEQYRTFLDRPEVWVRLKQPSGQTVYITGEVNEPSAHPLDGPLTVLGAIQQAGGLRPTAGTTAILMRERDGGDFQAFAIDLEGLLGNQSPDVYLRAHDILYVKQSGIAQVDLLFEQYVRNMIPDAVFLLLLFYFGPFSLPFF
jgi:polysaccharide export outer membrane protein